ncbi:hypothetical protein BCR35DRAFT_315997 [Leucosporidium creatinivorum]|uniref:RING-type domain-containing protein n=1 Tax=Leucosporidium creatinivorum TaxID=106004 RepID=A0A1Y2D8D0_9BASI|nr:hypothetical protein BCR35DRAFT_315997 [Leucosporidium creatinivorum]
MYRNSLSARVVCQDVFEQATLSGCEEDHGFCADCIGNWVTVRETCPTCREEITEDGLQEVRLLDRLVAGMSIECSFEECDWEGENSDFDDHVSSCSHSPVPCPNVENGCTLHFSIADLQDHLPECPWSTEICPRGGQDCGGEGEGLYHRKDRKEHFDVCENHRCPTTRCTTVGTRAFLITHTPGCRAQEAARKLAEAEVKNLRREVASLKTGDQAELGKIPEHLICTSNSLLFASCSLYLHADLLQVCQEVLERGTLSGCSEDHPFCYDCIKTWVKKNGTCPLCVQRTKESQLRETKLLSREVGCLRARCVEEECGWEGEFSELQPHLDSTLSDHIKYDCSFTLFRCARGGVDCGGPNKGTFTRGPAEDAHDAVCEAYRCTTSTCTTIGTLKLIQAHTPGCAAMDQARKSAIDEAASLRERTRFLEQSLSRAQQRIVELERSRDRPGVSGARIFSRSVQEMDAPPARKRPRDKGPLLSRMSPVEAAPSTAPAASPSRKDRDLSARR